MNSRGNCWLWPYNSREAYFGMVTGIKFSFFPWRKTTWGCSFLYCRIIEIHLNSTWNQSCPWQITGLLPTPHRGKLGFNLRNSPSLPWWHFKLKPMILQTTNEKQKKTHVEPLNPHSWHLKIWLVVSTYPSEKIWVRQLGWWNSQYMESHKIHVPNHQPEIVALSMGLLPEKKMTSAVAGEPLFAWFNNSPSGKQT